MQGSVIIWDSPDEPSVSENPCYRWAGYGEHGNVRSLLSYTEENGERLREKYVTWIHDLGEHSISGKRIIDHLALDDEFSYWWMTLLVEMSPWKTPSIIDAVRLFAVEEILLKEKPKKLILLSADRRLKAVFRLLCSKLSISFEWKKCKPAQVKPAQVKSVWQRVAFWGELKPYRAFRVLAGYVMRRWPRGEIKSNHPWKSDNALFFCSFFFHLNARKLQEGQFHTGYWEDLHFLTKELGLSENWLQLYYAHDMVSDFKSATSLIEKINRNSKSEFHCFLDSHLSVNVIAEVIRRYIFLLFSSWRLRGIYEAFTPNDSNFSLWPLMKNDWLSSLRGAKAVESLIFVSLFDRAMGSMPSQKKGIYLCENQAWERALIHFWHRHGHGQLIGVVHSSLRFWDFRYYSDARTLRSKNKYLIPYPDIVAVNGQDALNEFIKMGYPAKKLAGCEALRYNYLIKETDRKKKDKKIGRGVNILILGDYFLSTTDRMLEIIGLTYSNLGPEVSITFKPHPNYPTDGDACATKGIAIVKGPIGTILADYDIVISGSLTTAAVDAYLFGLPVIVVRDENDLNFSPLRNQPDVHFVSTARELLNVLRVIDTEKKDRISNNGIFFLDQGLPRWKRLIQM